MKEKEMPTTMLKQLLDEMMEDCPITSEELPHALAHIFTSQPTACSFGNPAILNILAFLRELVVTHELYSIEELCGFFSKRQENMLQILDDIFEESKEQDSVLSHIQIDSNYLRNEIGGLFLNSQNTIPAHSFEDHYEELYHYLEQSWQFSNREMALIDLHKESKRLHRPTNLNYLLTNDVSRAYWQQFSPDNGIDNFLLIVGSHHGVKNNLDTLCIERHEMHVSEKKRLMIQYYAEGSIEEEYFALLNIIKKEEPISDNRLKRQLVDWLVWAKINSTGFETDCCNQKDTWFDIACTTIVLSDLGSDHCSTEQFSLWIEALYEKKFLIRKWIILKSPDGYSWLTSDNPGFNLHLEAIKTGSFDQCSDPIWLNMRYDSILYFPLSKKYCLRVQPKENDELEDLTSTPIEFKESSEKEVDVVNMLTFSMHHKMVIVSDKKMLKQYQLI